VKAGDGPRRVGDEGAEARCARKRIWARLLGLKRAVVDPSTRSLLLTWASCEVEMPHFQAATASMLRRR
jgi:hypothetical protein